MHRTKSNNKTSKLSKEETELALALTDLRKSFHQALARRHGLPEPDPKYLHELLLTERDEALIVKEISDYFNNKPKGFVDRFLGYLKKTFSHA